MRAFLVGLILASASLAQSGMMLTARRASTASGALAGTVSITTTAVNLASVGTTDWIGWAVGTGGVGGCPGTNRKASGSSLIIDYTIGAGESDNLTTTDGPIQITWTGGTPTSSTTNSVQGCFNSPGNISEGYTFGAPCSTAAHTLIFYGFATAGTKYSLTASLSDSSATPYTNSGTSASGVDSPFTYTFTYQCATSSQTISVAWTSNGGNVGVEGAAYQ